MNRPVFVYDDDCDVCTRWAEFVDARSDLRVVGFSDLEPGLRDRLPDDYEDCSHLVTDGEVYSCGASVERALLRTDLGPLARPFVESSRHCPAYPAVREWGYRRVADNRSLVGRVVSTMLPPGPPRRRDDSG